MADSADRETEDERLVGLQTQLDDKYEELAAKFQLDGLDRDAAREEVVARLESMIEAASGPLLDDDGYIPPLSTCREAELPCWFGWNRQREGLLDRVRRWLGLARAVGVRRFLLDGSFVTSKEEPGDVDAVALLPEGFGDQLAAGNPAAAELFEMLRTRRPKELFAAEDEADWWAWFEFFSRTREANGRRKGLIEVTL
jgi:hypothetical protein